MAVTYFTIIEHEEGIYFVWRIDDRAPEVSRVSLGICECCQRPYLAIPVEDAASDIIHKIQLKNRPIFRAGFKGSDLDIFTCETREVSCSQCGRPIALPIPELLDAERTAYGRYVASKNTRSYPDHPRNIFSWKRPNTWRET